MQSHRRPPPPPSRGHWIKLAVLSSCKQSNNPQPKPQTEAENRNVDDVIDISTSGFPANSCGFFAICKPKPQPQHNVRCKPELARLGIETGSRTRD